MLYFRQYWRAGRGGLFGWAVGLGLYVYLLMSLFPTIKEQAATLDSYLEAMPDAIKAMMGAGMSIGSLTGFLNAEVYSWLPFLLTIYAAIAVAGIVSREIDSGTAEFLFGLPVGRARLVAERFAATGLNLALLHAVVLGVAWVAAVAAGEEFPAAPFLRATAMGFLVALAVAALILFISIFIPDYTRALVTGMGAGAGLYFVTIGVRAARPDSPVLPWTIFGRYLPGELLAGGAAGADDVVVLVAYTAVLVAASALVLARRDLRL